jgi:transcriptional regulator GlxA family with amidase domain
MPIQASVKGTSKGVGVKGTGKAAGVKGTSKGAAGSPTRRLIVIATFENAQLLDIAGPLETFSLANRLSLRGDDERRPEEWPYRIVVATRGGGTVHSNSGLPIQTKSLRAVDRLGAVDTLIASGGTGVHAAVRDAALVSWIRRKAPQARRVCSVCTGAFLLAEAGVLAGRRATTHWRSCRRLQDRFPEVRVEPDSIYVNDGAVWTSAGVTAGIDLALALVQKDLGHRVAMNVARELVVYLKRPGGQSQFSAPLALQDARGDRFSDLHAWIAEHLHEDLRVERLARQAGMSPRTFARAYVAEVGRTPAKTVAAMRLEAARRALEEGRAPLKKVAADAGFESDQRLRRAFRRAHGLRPLDYRQRFAAERGGRR